MRHLLLLVGLAGAARAASAQQPGRPAPGFRPVVSAGVFSFGAGAGVQAEQRLGRHFSLGLQGERYFSSHFPGYQASVLARYYFRPTAPAGLYLQVHAGAYSARQTVVGDYFSNYSRDTYNIGGKGGGLGLGYQWRVGPHLALSAGLGLKLYYRSLGYCDCMTEGDWYAVGQPGSLLDGQLSIGYAF